MTQYIRTYVRNGVIEHIATQETPFDFDPISVQEHPGAAQGTPNKNVPMQEVVFQKNDLEMDGPPVRAKDLRTDLETTGPGGAEIRFKAGRGAGRNLRKRQ